MMKSAFKIETAFSKAPKVEVIAQLVEKIEKEIEQNVMDLVDHEGSGTWVKEASGDYQDDSSSSQKLWHLFY